MQLNDGVLGHRLGERIDVGETHRVGVDAAALDELVLDPTVAKAFRRSCDSRRAGRTHLRARLAAQALQDLRSSRLLFHHWA